jgi:tetratricopeptide (TPR) repeat protein
LTWAALRSRFAPVPEEESSRNTAMEILILLAGEQIGPFSEQRVRQYLEEGLVTPSDLALAEGTTEWQAVDHLLASLPSAPAASAPEAPRAADKVPDPFATTKSLPQLIQSMTAAQKAKLKPAKIVVQPMLPIETTASPVPETPRTRTGKTAITVETPRPTTSLPSLGAMPPRERKTGRLPQLRADLFGHDFSGTRASTVPARPPPLPGPATPPALPVVLPQPVSHEPQLPPLSNNGTKLATKPWIWLRSREVIYAASGLALLILILICLSIFIMYRHHAAVAQVEATLPAASPAPADTENYLSSDFIPNSAADFSNRGLARQAKGDLKGAITDFNSAVAVDPQNAQAFYRRGLAKQALDDRADAIADFTEVIRLNPRNADAYSSRAFLKQFNGDPDGALADYAQALLINPRISIAYYNEGLIKVQKGDLEGAIADYSQALDIDPKMDKAYYNRGAAKSTEGNVDGAIADYTQALVLNPQLAVAYSSRGFSRQSKGDDEGALADYAQALALDPRNAGALYNRSLIDRRQGNLDATIADSSKAIDIDPKYAQAYLNRGMARYGRGDLDGALADLRKLCELAPRDDDTDNARLYIWLISTQENPKGNANGELTVELQNDWNSPPEDPVSKIAAFLQGRLSEADLITNLTSPDPLQDQERHGKGWYFAGMKKLLAGDVANAVEDFHKCVAIGKKDSDEYTFARLELQSLAKTQPWTAQP